MPREKLRDLLGQPGCRRMPGYFDPQQLPTAVADDQKGKQVVKVHGWDDHHIDGGDCISVIAKKCLAGL